MTLTATAIAKIKPAASRRELPDRDGLFLVVQPSGAKSWAFRYRSPLDGKHRKLTIGSYLDFDIGRARERAFEARQKVRLGIDPVDEAKAAKARAMDRSHLMRDMLDDYLKKYDGERKASSAAEVRRLIDKWVRPMLDERRVQDVGRRDIEAILASMVKAGAPVSANRLLAALKPFFSWVRVGGDPLPALPTDNVGKPTSEEGRDRDRVLSDSELRWLWKATDDNSAFSAAIRLMLLTGQRRGEVSGMLLVELDLDAADPVWLLPAPRTKNGRENLVPLAPAAIAAINRPPHIGRAKLVLTSTSGTELSGWSKSKIALDERMLAIASDELGRAAMIEPWVLHDLRRTAATGMARLGQPIHVIEAVLNHKTGAITKIAGIYNRWSYAAEKRAALTSWAAFIEGLA